MSAQFVGLDDVEVGVDESEEDGDRVEGVAGEGELGVVFVEGFE